MRVLALASLLALAACSNESNLGNTLNGDDDGVPDAEVSTPDAIGPHNFIIWAVSLDHDTPDHACDVWTLDDTAVADPSIDTDFLTLTAGSGEQMTYAQRGSDLMEFAPDSTVVLAGLKLVSGSARLQFTYNGLTDGITISDGLVTTDGGGSHAMVTTDMRHEYRMEIDLWTGRVDARIDNNTFAVESAGTAGAGVVPEILFGQIAPGTSDWTEVAHEVHAATTCPDP
jgi:hypothetical protein